MYASTPLIISGAVIFILFAVLGFGGLDLILHAAVRKMLVLKENSKIWNIWRTMPLPIYLRLRFFNITNPDGLAKGEKAILHEMGPYTYLEDWEKEDLSVDLENDTVRYRMTKTYFFQPELSAGTEDDLITFINVVFLASANIASDMSLDEFMMSQLNDILSKKNETLTKTATVRQIVFDGASAQAYVEMFEDPIVAEVAASVGLGIPENIKDGLFAILKHKNGTDDGWFEVKSGSGRSGELAQIVRYNEETKLKYWRGNTCNSVNGSDGTMHPPFLTRDTVLSIFAPAICRSFELEYHSDMENKGLQTYRFIGSPKNWMAPKSNPDNWCFCKPLINKTELESCMNDGVFSIWPCTAGAPILVSYPHFYGAEEWIRNGAEGLNPDFDKHMTIMDFHPLTGSPIEVRGRLQLSIELVPYESMSMFADVRRAVIPFLWFEEGSELDGETLTCLQFIEGFTNGFSYAKYVLMVTGFILVSIGVILLVLRRNKKQERNMSVYMQELFQESPMEFGSTFTFLSNQ